MKKNKILWVKRICLVIFFLVILSGVAFGIVKLGTHIHQKIVAAQVNDSDWMAKNVSIKKSQFLGNNIYYVERPSNVPAFHMVFQDVIGDKLDELLKKNYSFEKPLLIYNLYGTNELGVNLYFETEEDYAVSYTIHVDKEDYPDFSRTLYNGGEENLSNKHQYQLIGFVPGEKNYVTISLRDDNDTVVKEQQIEIDFTTIKVNAQVRLDTEEGSSSEELAGGLYAMLGNDSDKQDYLALYDNNGVLRSETEIIGYRAHRILFRNQKMYYSISQTKIAEVDSLGQVTNIYQTGQYQLHHDYTFDNDGNLLVLANNTKKSTEEDCIIKIDLETKAVTEVIDFAEMFASYVKTCELDTTSTRDEGEDGIDWLHLNSIVYLDGDIILSSRETSSILRVNNIEEKPELVYLLADSSFWEDTEFSSYVYEKKGDFKIHAGQHSLNYQGTEEEGVYYLTFFDNNYGKSNSQPTFDYNTIGISNTKSPFQGDYSYYYVYKVDEEARTFELVDSFEVTYSGIVSSVQSMANGNIVVDSGTSGEFSEYDNEHTLIRTFHGKLNKYMMYRIFKYDFNNFWFQEG